MGRPQTRLEISGPVASLTLTRPAIRNAITGPEMLSEVVEGFERAARDPAITVMVVTGEGTAFSAGGNVQEMAERTGLFAGSPDEMSEAYRGSIQRLPASFDVTSWKEVAQGCIGPDNDQAG